MGLARASARQLVARASEYMLARADAKRIHEGYVVPALELLENAETHAVLAAADDPDALAAIERLVKELDGFNRALEEEYPD
jgi:hypothetical protein